MKKYLTLATVLVIFLALSTTCTSCKAGYGCPAEEAYYKSQENPKPASNKRGKSNLFSKKDRKKAKSGN